MIKVQAILNFALLSSTMLVYASEHAMVSLLNDALGNMPSRGVPDMSGILLPGKNHDDRGRVLQDTATCDASRIDELYSDPTLNATYAIYVNNLIQALFSAGECQFDNNNLLVCPVQQTIDGEAEYQSACIAAGGQIEPIQADLICTYPAGNDPTEYYDIPPFLLCSPVDDTCAASARENAKDSLDALAFAIQEGLEAEGIVTDASCRISEGQSSSAADMNGIGFASMTMVLMSLIVGFHFY